MSHERGSVPAPKGGTHALVETFTRALRRLRRHVREWPRRYVEMRVGDRKP